MAGMYQAAKTAALPDYHTTEYKTGQKWTDGKDIYQCVFSFPNININNQETTLTTIATGLNMVDIKGIFTENNKQYEIPDMSIRILYYITDGNVRIYSPSGWSGSAELILSYTKP